MIAPVLRVSSVFREGLAMPVAEKGVWLNLLGAERGEALCP